MSFRPSLEAVQRDGVSLLTDPKAEALGVRLAFSDRTGGVSSAPFESLNLSTSVGDDPEKVAENRRRVAAALGFPVEGLALLRQIHGAHVVEVGAGQAGVVGTGDVVVASAPGTLVGVLTADCVPVLLAGQGSVAAVHAGWRGLVAGAIEAGVERVGEVRAAWVGPAIHGCCYEVGAEVVEAFRARGLPVVDRAHVDPGRAAVVALRHAGVEHIAAVTDCTSCDRSYFSHRRDRHTGRQGAFIGLPEQ